ncbi:MAG: NTP transferase domain-containing protein [Methanosarcinales archaeon]|nr:NTP transferase domain-containing protein [Methanosarcinales archaeon]
MYIVAIIQARMGSTRLPEKVMREIGKKTMLSRVVQRTARSELIDKIVVATTTKTSDDPIVAECDRLNVSVFRGDEQDVLDRYYRAAMAYQAEAIVRITSDCPLIEPEVVDRVIRVFLDESPDYASNSLEKTYPRGLDTEVVTMEALIRAWQEATEPYQRVHVTPYIFQNPDQFTLLPVKSDVDYSRYRWTVDTQEDLDFVRAIYSRFGNEDAFTWNDVLSILTAEPELAEINRHIRQKSLEEG